MARFLVLPTLLLLAGLGATVNGQPVRVEDGFINAVHASELAAQVPSTVDEEGTFAQPVGVPASLYARLVAAIAPTGAAAEAAAAGKRALAAATTVMVPSRTQSNTIKPHQDHFDAGAVAETVGVLYLAGDGQMAFTHKETGETTVVDVKPGRLLAWKNAEYTHSVVPGAVERVMLGPMAFKGGAVHEVGDNGGWIAHGQLCLKSLLASPGKTITATTTIVVEGWEDQVCCRRRKLAAQPLDIVLAYTADPGVVSFVKASLAHNTWRPKLQPVQSGSTITFTIPADQVPLLKEIKVTWTFRVAKTAPKGTPIAVEAGVLPGNWNDAVGVLVK